MSFFCVGRSAFSHVTPTRVYTDASVRHRVMGIGIYWADQNRVVSRQIPPLRRDVTYAELYAIYHAIRCTDIYTPMIIYTDSQASLTHIQPIFDYGSYHKPKYNMLIGNIRSCLLSRLAWTAVYKVKAHSGLIGNEIADHMAKLATRRSHLKQ